MTCQDLIELLTREGLTVATAESCTGGLIAKYLTDVPGASRVYAGGAVTYTNEAKMTLLGVSRATLDTHTEISAACALEMACGIRARLGTDIGVATTGLAGPGGGTPACPVGTVYLAVVTGTAQWCEDLAWPSTLSREEIRERTAAAALCKIAEMTKK